MNSKVTQTELLKTAFREFMKSVGTNVPGHILSFDKDTQLAQVQIGIEQVDVNGKTDTPTPLIEVYVWMGGGDYLVETQIDEGTEGLIIFSQRCIDGWTDTGGVAKNPILRFHDLSDAFFLPGIRSQPNKISSFQNNGIRLRDKAGDNYIWLKNDGTVEMKAVDVNIISNSLTHNSVNVGDDHTHSGVTTGGGTSGPPV